MSNYTKTTNFATKDNLSPGNPLKIVKGAEIDTEFNNIATAVATKTDNASAAITGGAIDGAAIGGTTPAAGAFTTLAASGTTTLAGALVGAATQAAFNTTTTTLNLGGAATAVNLGAATGTATVNNTTLAAKAITASTTLNVTGASTLTGAVTATAGVTGPITSSSATITGGSITGITDLAVADGGTGASTAAGALNNLLPSQTSNANKYLQTDGTNASWDAVSLSTADITGTLPVANGGTGVTTSTGTTNVVLSNSPTLVTPALGTPSSAVLTNATGLPISTGVSGLGAGVATLLATPSSANLASAITDETGSGSLVFATSPTLVTPILGTPTSGTLTNATGLPISTGVSGLGTGVATFLATPSSANLAAALTDETGSGANVFATSPTLVTPILGTPTSATLTNATGLPLTTGVTGTLPVANGGTGTATPSIVAGTNVTVTGTWPNQTIAASGGSTSPGGSTTQVQYNNAGAFGGITGATSNGTALTLVAPVLGTPASATLTNATGLPLSTGVTGTLPVANGGTGLTTTPANGALDIGNGTGFTRTTLTAGSNITITNSAGGISIAASGGGGTPAGSTTQIQYNNAGAFGASSNFVWDNTNTRLGIGTSSPQRTFCIQNGGPVVEIDPAGIGSADPIYFNYNRTTSTYTTPQYYALAHIWCYTGGNEGMRLNSSGNVQLQKNLSVGAATPTTSGTGITFPATQSASTDANTLDDYEEGTWSPGVTPSSGTLTTHTSSGTYTKIGRTVHITFNSVITTPGSASGTMNISAFPFTNGNGYQVPTVCREQSNVGTAYQAVLSNSGTTGFVRSFTEGSISWTAGNQYVFFMTYIV